MAAVIAAGVISGGGDDDAALPSQQVTFQTSPASAPDVTIAPPPVETIAADDQVATATTDVPVTKTQLGQTIGFGNVGGGVTRVQQRLVELGFEPGPVDGNFGSFTRQAVWAFEKLVMGVPRSEATGRVTPEMWSRMQDPIQIQPRRPTGGLADHVEIYLPEQVMIIFHGDTPALVTHISSGELDENGDPAPYCEEATITDRDGVVLEEPITGISCGEAKTPGGVFKIRRFVEGKRVSPLGGMQNPAYFNYGIAIHGAQNVPLEPASHGCIRVNDYIGDYFQGLLAKGDRVLVWNGEKEPEQITENESLPFFDRFTPDTTTTSTTTTTTTTTVPAPTTTKAPPPATTTTVATPTTTSTTTTVPPTTTAPPDDG